MSSVDSRVVTMKFDNAQFERGAAQTMSTLDKLKRLLGFDNAGKGLQDVQKAANGFHLNPVETSIGGVKKSFLALATIGVTALHRLTNAAINAGQSFARGFFGPIKSGLEEYETNLNSIQTVLANTGLRGQKGLDKVNHALDELNHYSDQTIYNFSEMARNVGTFTAAGIKLKPATAAIKGIANLAAVSGSSSQQASTAMYQLSQALAAGKVSLMDWNSVVNAGMGGKVFQKAIKETARVHGVAVDSIIKDAGSFRASISKGWITDKILTESLQKFTGDLSKEQLRQQGYTKKQIADIMRLGKTAQDAATKVKTWTQLKGTLKEAAQSGWAQSWELVLGDFNEAKKLWTGVNDVLGGFIQRSAEARNKVLGDWKALGGRTVMLEGIGNAFKALMNIIKPIRNAFRDIFPAMTGQRLYDMTVAFRNFTEGLSVGGSTMDNLRRTFKGIFAVLDIGKQIVVGILKSFFGLFSVAGDGSGGILNLTGDIGDLLVSLRDWLTQGDKIGAFFDRVKVFGSSVLGPLVGIFNKVVSALGNIATGGFEGFITGVVEGFSALKLATKVVGKNLIGTFDKLDAFAEAFGLKGLFDGFKLGSLDASRGLEVMNTALDTTKKTTEDVKDGVSKVGDAFSAVGNFLAGIGRGIAHAFDVVKDKLGTFFEGIGIEDTLAVTNTGFLIALYIAFRKFLNNVGGVFEELKGTFRSASGVLDQVTNNLKSMQTEVRARSILMIAGALALLAASLWVLSKIDTDDLTKSLVAVVVLLGALTGAILLLEKKTASMGGAARVSLLAGAMLLMGAAMLAMAGAVKVLATLDTNELVKGITAMAAILAVVTGAAAILEKTGGAGQMVIAAGAILVLAAALTAFAGAIKLFSAIDTGTLVEGGAKIAAVMVAVGLLMRGIPTNAIGGAAALLIVAGALVVMAKALQMYASMSVGEIAKSLVTLSVALAAISLGLRAMTGTVKGSAALLLAAAAIAVLVPSLVILGNLDIDTITKALGALAAIFVVLGVAGYVLGPIVPAIMGLAGAVALLAGAVALIGGGVLMFAIGLATLAASGAAGIAVLTAAIIAVAELFPLLMHQFGLGIAALALVISKQGPALVAAFDTVLESIIRAVILNTPRLAKMLMVLIRNGLAVLRAAFPDLVRTGIQLIRNLLDGINQNIDGIVRTVGQIIRKFLGALAREVPKTVDAGIEFIIKFINGIADAIEDHTAELVTAGVNLGTAILQGLAKGLADAVGIDSIVSAAKSAAKNALDAAKNFLGIKSPSKEFEKLGKYVNQGFAKGLIGGVDVVNDAMAKFADLVQASIDANKAKVDDLKSELEQLKENPKKNADKIEKVTKALEIAEKRYKTSKETKVLYNKSLKDERAELMGLGKQYDDYTKKIDEAQKKLEEAQKAKLDYANSVTSQYTRMPDIGTLIKDYASAKDAAEKAAADAEKAQIDAITNALPDPKKNTLRTYKAQLEREAADIEKFMASLDQLRAMGLDDASYRKFVGEGPGIQRFVDQLIQSGPEGIAEIDRLSANLGAATQRLKDQLTPASTQEVLAQTSPLETYKAQLTKEATDNETFLASLAQLRAMGLDDESYKRFVEQGVTIQPFINELIASGPQGVAEINNLTSHLSTAARNLGTTASNELHDVGINIATTLVETLKGKRAEIAAEMSAIGRVMIRALRRALRIKSPSRVMEEIGKYTNQGLSKGLEKHAKMVEKSGENVGTAAVDSIKSSLKNISSTVMSNVDATPTIRPVLDLTQVGKDASQLNGMFDKQAIAVASYGEAASISNEQAARIAERVSEISAEKQAKVVEFTQNNYSPKALSPVEIYRQTRNQLSLAKEALDT